MAEYQIIEINVNDKEAKLNVHPVYTDIQKAQEALDDMLKDSRNLTNKELDNDLEKLHIHLDNNVTEAHLEVSEGNKRYLILTVNIKTK